MGVKMQVYRAVRYIYPDCVVPGKVFVVMNSTDPGLVPYQLGSIGFSFAKVMEFELPNGEKVDHIRIQDLVYYWGQEVDLNDLRDSPDCSNIMENSDAERFCITSWGGLIPLYDDEAVVDYPRLLEDPVDLGQE